MLRRHTFYLAILIVAAAAAISCGVDIDQQRREVGNQINDIARRIESREGSAEDLLRALEAQLARDLNRTALHALDQVKTIERESLVSAGTQARCTIDYVPTTVAVRLRNILPSLLRQPLKNFPAAVVCALVPPSIDLASQSQSILTVSGGYLAKASAKAFVHGAYQFKQLV